MIKKLTPVKFEGEAQAAINAQLGVQEVQKSTPKSLDPINFPVFDVPVNKKVLIYVPNHVTIDKEGKEILRMDTPFIHSVTDGKRYLSYRCISNVVVEGTEFNGDCPLCDGCEDSFTYANYLIEDKCKAQNLDPSDKESDPVKTIRRDCYGDMVLKTSDRYYTFPIVVFETINDEGKTLVLDDAGNAKCKAMWYSIRESQYVKTWAKSLEMMEDEPTHPGGQFFILNYTYTPKHGEPNKRDSARALQVGPKKFKDSEQMKKSLDKMTEEWTPEKARDVVCNNVIYSPTDLLDVVDTVLVNTRNMIALYEAKNASTGAPAIEGNTVADAGFNLEKQPNAPADVPPAMDDTDLDDLDVE